MAATDVREDPPIGSSDGSVSVSGKIPAAVGDYWVLASIAPQALQ